MQESTGRCTCAAVGMCISGRLSGQFCTTQASPSPLDLLTRLLRFKATGNVSQQFIPSRRIEQHACACLMPLCHICAQTQRAIGPTEEDVKRVPRPHKKPGDSVPDTSGITERHHSKVESFDISDLQHCRLGVLQLSWSV